MAEKTDNYTRLASTLPFGDRGDLNIEGDIYRENIQIPESLMLVPSDFEVQGGSPVISGSAGSGAVPGWLLDAAADEGVTHVRLFPSNWSSFNIDVFYGNVGAGAGDIRLRVIAAAYDIAASTFTVLSDVSRTITVAADGILSRYVDFVTNVPIFDVTKPIRLHIMRDADHAADTLANDAEFLGMLVKKA